MTDKLEQNTEVRQRRKAVYDAAELLKSLPDDGNEHQLDWDVLQSVPDWCYWSEDKRLALASTAGALFLAPVMRFWIDAERLRDARQILGESLFNAVMEYEALPQVVEQPPEELPVDILLLSSGASVLLGSLNPALQGRLSALLPAPSGQVHQTIAKQLADESETLLLRLTAEFVAAQEKETSEG